MPSVPLGTYDPTEQIVIFGGIQIDGYGPGSFIKASRDEEGWTFQPSNSGGGSRSRNPNKAGKLVFTLLASSPANALLSAIAVTDELTAEGIGECLVKDRSTGDSGASCFAQNAWIIKHPDYERMKEVGEIEWTIQTDELQVKHAGLLPVTTL